MKLFIYNSFTGSGEIVASYLANKGYELRRVYEKKKMPKSFFLSMMVGGFRAGMNQKGKLVDYNPNVSSYEEVVIGTPIWNARLTPITNSVLEETDLKDKKLTFVIYSGSGTGPKAEEKIKGLFPNAKIIFLKDPKKYPDELTKLENL